MTHEELTELLDKNLWEIGNALMEYYDPCQIDGSSCRVGDPNPCCIHTRFGDGLCPFQDNGCHNPNASCRLWICKTAIQATDPVCVEGLKLLMQFGHLFGVAHRPLIGQGYVGADRPKT